MTESAPASGLLPIYLAKGTRVYVSGLMSIVIPFYLGRLGYGYFFQALVLVAILAGNALSNVAVTYLDALVGRRRMLQTFSALMVVAGGLFVSSTSGPVIVLACLIGNISSTGTEAGPFQSIEAGVLPNLAPGGSTVKAFGSYNLVGYSAAAFGQLSSVGPSLFGYSLESFQVIFAGFGLVGILLFAVYSRLRGLETGRGTKGGFAGLSQGARRDVVRLSALFSLDAFGGVFVSTYLLSIWFHATYGLQLDALGTIFFVASVIAAASTYGAALIAGRLGNLRTMVSTHLVSSTFLLLMPFAGTLGLAVAFLFLRQSLSQMDVPTRQALMAEMFQSEERVQAYALTNILRSAGAFLGGPVAAGILGFGYVSGILFAGGGTKVAYDLMTFGSYHGRYR